MECMNYNCSECLISQNRCQLSEEDYENCDEQFVENDVFDSGEDS